MPVPPKAHHYDAVDSPTALECYSEAAEKAWDSRRAEACVQLLERAKAVRARLGLEPPAPTVQRHEYLMAAALYEMGDLPTGLRHARRCLGLPDEGAARAPDRGPLRLRILKEKAALAVDCLVPCCAPRPRTRHPRAHLGLLTLMCRYYYLQRQDRQRCGLYGPASRAVPLWRGAHAAVRVLQQQGLRRGGGRGLEPASQTTPLPLWGPRGWAPKSTPGRLKWLNRLIFTQK